MARIGVPTNAELKAEQDLLHACNVIPTTVVNKYREPYSLYIGRGSKWGNPFTHIPTGTKASYIVKDRDEAIAAYKQWITTGDGKHLLNDLHELQGQTLGCFCKPKACHGDVLVELVNQLTDANINRLKALIK